MGASKDFAPGEGAERIRRIMAGLDVEDADDSRKPSAHAGENGGKGKVQNHEQSRQHYAQASRQEPHRSHSKHDGGKGGDLGKGKDKGGDFGKGKETKGGDKYGNDGYGQKNRDREEDRAAGRKGGKATGGGKGNQQSTTV